MSGLFRRFLDRRHASDARADAADAFLRTPPASMAEVRPPAALNDDLLRSAYIEVEREMRIAGLIR